MFDERFIQPVGRARPIVGVAVADEKGDPADEDGGLARTCSGQHQKRVLHRKDRLALAIVQVGVHLVK